MNAMQMPVCIRLEDNFWDQLMWDKDLSDTTIQVKGKDGQVRWEFSLHSIVLRRRSKVFKQLITKIGETLVFEDVDIAVLNKFIKYLYMGDVFVETWREIMSLVELSTKYEVTSLTKELEENLPKFINLVNVCTLLDESIRLNLNKMEMECLSLLVRSGMVIFGTAGFQGLSEGALVKVLSDDRLNVPREVDALLALICWARNSAFLKGTKVDDQGLFEKISPRLLTSIRLTLIKEEERALVPSTLASLIFAKKEEENKEEAGEDDDETKEKVEPPEEKARTPSTETCLLGHFASLVLRKPGLAISWPGLGHANTLALRFSVTMPIFLGGFLAVYRCNGPATLYIMIQDTKKGTDVKHVFKPKKCEHVMYNEEVGYNWHNSVCFEPASPLMVYPGQQVSVFFQMAGPNFNETWVMTFPTTVFLAGHKWWGPGNGPADAANAKIASRPFQIKVEDSVLEDLKRRLQNTRLSSPLEDVAFQYGMNTDHLRTILDYWQTKYDWRKEEARLNQLPQFLAKIEGIDVHYVHVKPPSDNKVKVLPLLMIHGWPGSFVEFYKIIPLLTSGVNGVAFEVICPSIPGYGFSEAPHHPGFSAVEAARVFSKLMHSLGHQKYYLQGGDWGSLIVTIMSILYPERAYGVHLNMALPRHNSITMVKYIAGLLAPSLMFEKNEKFNIYPPGELVSNMLLETGYMHIQSTKPDTVGVGLSDSPAGLAAYMLEKFSTWTDNANREKKDGGLLKKYSLDELLTNVMVYWVTNSITSSTRFYKENVNPSIMKLNFDLLPVLVPTGIATLPNEIITFPRTMLQHKYPQILTFNYLERGGHFAAMEEPRLLAEDFRAFVTAAEALLDEQKREAKKQEAKKKEL